MLALTALVGLLSVLLVAAVRVGYLAISSGRMCPQCGGGTNSVEFGRIASLFARWIQKRWCSRCGWEGIGRNGPDVAPYESPVDHDSGFRWRRRQNRAVPVFWWGDRSREDAAAGRAHPSGFHWGDAEELMEDPDHPSGFRFRGEEDADGPVFEWGDREADGPLQKPEGPRGFQWKDSAN